MRMVDNIGYTMTLQEIADFIVKHGAKCSCGYQYKKTDIECYDHTGGISVLGSQQKQWVYMNCKLCEIDRSLWKILNRIEREKEVLHQ